MAWFRTYGSLALIAGAIHHFGAEAFLASAGTTSAQIVVCSSAGRMLLRKSHSSFAFFDNLDIPLSLFIVYFLLYNTYLFLLENLTPESRCSAISGVLAASYPSCKRLFSCQCASGIATSSIPLGTFSDSRIFFKMI